MVKILAFDTCNSLCSVALIDNGQIIEYKYSDKLSKQAEQLLPFIEETLAIHNLNYSNLAALALTVGPGSFTGIRVGIAAAQGIRLASNLPVIPVNCFEAIAFNIKEKCEMAITLDARRNQLYFQKFNMQNSLVSPMCAPSLVSFEHAVDLIGNNSTVAGSGLRLIKDLLLKHKPKAIINSDFEIIDARMTGFAAWLKYINKIPSQKLKPLYIRFSDAKLPLN